MARLELDGLSVSYGAVRVLPGLDLTVGGPNVDGRVLPPSFCNY